ncbi:hypothetical protein A3Q56_00325 [Intoshia linei]|uniref:Uncharacterized protein n=1 Tax=Intoshia linei TaxID=1819745 RepID=A0A177BC43_9BILA|nr:hypothetical protein A3Q56_00325 [Intoshia linei]
MGQVLAGHIKPKSSKRKMLKKSKKLWTSIDLEPGGTTIEESMVFLLRSSNHYKSSNYSPKNWENDIKMEMYEDLWKKLNTNSPSEIETNNCCCNLTLEYNCIQECHESCPECYNCYCCEECYKNTYNCIYEPNPF